MSSVSGKPVESEILTAESSSPAPAAGFKIFNRIVDWITGDRMPLINVADRIKLQSLHTTTAEFINEWRDAFLHDVRSQGLILQRRNLAVLHGTWQSIILAGFASGV